MTETAVLVLTNERDFAADAVIQRISGNGGTVERLNIEGVLGGSAPSLRLDKLGMNVGCVWWRQFEVERPVSSLADADDLLVERAQWRSWLATLNVPTAAWVNPLWEARRAENKVEQVRCATASGFSVPPTLVTNRRHDARVFAADVGPCVVKTLAAGYFELTDRSFVFTRGLEEVAAIGSDADWCKQPLLIQRRVPRDADVRVVSFGGLHFGGMCRAGGPDWRLLSSAVQWHAWPVPVNLAKLCDRYLHRMGLRFAAFDFAIEDDHCWFLEANQAGEWLFLDRPLKLGIADALASYLLQVGHCDDGP